MTTESFSLGLVLERRRVDHPWQDYSWTPVSVFPGDPEGVSWRVLREGDGWVHFFAGTLELEFHSKETDGYRLNLSQPAPMIFVVLRPDEEGETDHEVIPFLVTACPHEAGSYIESGDEIVEGVPMPDEILTRLRDFVETHHVDVPFKKRKRKPYDPRKGGFDQGRGGGHG
jgi:hypothetical protein